MFKNFFQKKSPQEPIFPEESYSILKLNIQGSLAFATINKGYSNYQNKKFYPWYATILIDVLEQIENGHPTDEEAALLNSIEERITEFLKRTQVVHYIGRITRKSERDIIYYIDKPNFNNEELKFFFDSINSIRPLNLNIEKDESWNNISGFMK